MRRHKIILRPEIPIMSQNMSEQHSNRERYTKSVSSLNVQERVSRTSEGTYCILEDDDGDT